LKAKRVSIGFVGDICLARDIDKIVSSKGPKYLFERVRPYFADLDLIVGNLECTVVSNGRQTASTRRPLCATRETAASLAHSGIGVMNLANNHVMDCGSAGLASTMRYLDSLGIKYFGAGMAQEEAEAPLMITVNGLRVAFIGACDESRQFANGHTAGTAKYSKTRLFSRVRNVRKDADIVVAVLHADAEFVRHPSPHRRQLSRRLVEKGADAVIQHHPHVIQGIEYYIGKVISYSLGNHVFGFPEQSYQGQRAGTRESILLGIDFHNDGGNTSAYYRTVPLVLDDTHRPAPCDPVLSAQRDRELQELSARLSDSRYQRNVWRRYCREYVWRHIKQSYYELRRSGFFSAFYMQIEILRRWKRVKPIISFFTRGYI